MILDAQQKEMVEETFRAIAENKMNAGAFTSANTELMKGLAETLKVDKSDISEAFKFWKKRVENKKGTLENVNTICDALENA